MWRVYRRGTQLLVFFARSLQLSQNRSVSMMNVTFVPNRRYGAKSDLMYRVPCAVAKIHVRRCAADNTREST